MAKGPNLTQFPSNTLNVAKLNEAFAKINTAFENTISRDGSTPNSMSSDIDLNSNDILNVGVLDGDQINVNEAYIGGKLFTGTLTWRSDWLTATSYQELDLVKQSGTVYVCLEEHTSGVFATDLSSYKWEIFVEASGGGGGGVTDHGDLAGLSDDDHPQYHNDTRGDARYYTQSQVDSSLSGKANTSHTHTASDITNFDTEVANNSAVAANTAKVSNATHTGDVTGSTALTIANGAVTFAKLNAAAIVAESEGIASNDNDTTIPTSAAVKAYADSVGRVLLATRTASASATLDFTEFNNAVYRRYEFECENVLPSWNGGPQFRLLVSTNGGASYDTGAGDYSYARTEKILAAAESGAGGSAGGEAMAMAGNVGNDTGEQGVTGIIKIWSPGLAVRMTARWELHTFDAAAGGINLISGVGARLASQDTDGIRFLFNTGGITSGTIRMFGIV